MTWNTSGDSSRDQVNLSDVIHALWRGKWLVALLTVLLAAVAGGAAWLMPDKYEATILVSPATSTSGSGQLGGGLGAIASEFGGLASLAGITIGADAKKSESLAVLESQALTEKFIHENKLLPVLFSDEWDPQAMKWKTQSADKAPTLWKANRFFKGNVRTVETAKNGLVTMTITWTDPKAAADWANGIVRMTNEYLRDKAIAEAERNIAYLNEQALKTEIVGVRQAIYRLLESEINQAMIARGNEEFALRVLDPAAVPEVRSSPKPIIWILLAVFGSFLISAFIAFAQVAWTITPKPLAEPATQAG